MKGNFHVRFLEGRGLATARAYSVPAFLRDNLETRPVNPLYLQGGVEIGILKMGKNQGF